MDVEKSAGFGMVGLRKGIGTYIKNVSKMGINSAQKNLDAFKTNPFPKLPDGSAPTRQSYPEHINQLEKNLHNAKVSHNRAIAGTVGSAMLAGGGLGAYTAYQKSTDPNEVNDLMSQNQSSQEQQFMKAASDELTEIFHDNLVERLEKTAGIVYVPVQVPDQGDQEDVAAAQQAEVAPLPQPADPTQPGDPNAGIDPAQIGVTQQDEQQEGPVDASAQVAVNPGGVDPSAVDQGPVTEGTQPITPESQELQAILEAQQAERAQESQPAPQAGVPQEQQASPAQDPGADPAQAQGQGSESSEDDNEEEKPKRQGAGSISNAPAGEDKTASELLERLEKTANEVGEEDKTDDAPTPGRQPRKEMTERLIGAGAFGHKAKENNSWGVRPEDSHAKANAKVRAIEGGAMGASLGAVSGAAQSALGKVLKNSLAESGMGEMAEHLPEGGIIQGALIGAAIGGTLNAGVGAGMGAINGHFHDMWDKHHPIQQGEEEQTAMEETLVERLEKTAARGGGFVDDLLGKNVKRLQGHLGNAKKERTEANGLIHTKYPQPEAVAKGEKNVADAKKRQIKAIGTVGAGAAGVAGATGAAVKAHENNKQDKTASEDIIERLEKIAADSYTVDNSPMGGTPGDQAKKVNNFWHKLSPAEIQEEDQTEPNGDRNALYERLTQTSSGYKDADKASNLTKKAEEGAIDPDHDGDDDRPGSKNNPDKAEDDKKGVTSEAAKEEKEKDEDQEKKAFEIPGLAAAGGAIKNYLGNTGEFVRDLSGSQARAANQNIQRMWENPEALNMPIEHFQNEMPRMVENADALTQKTQTARNHLKSMAVPGGIGLAGIGGGVGLHEGLHHQHEQQQEQTASDEDIMNGLFKEAAAMIINEEIPEVKQHVDILDRITF